MSRLYRTTDRIKIKVDDIEVTISPLTQGRKQDLQGIMFKASRGDMDAAFKAVSDALKYAIKDIKGVTYEDANGELQPYKLTLDSNNEVDDSCMDDLMNLPESNKLTTICSSLIGGFSGKFVDAQGNDLEGVSVIPSSKPAEAGKH